VSVGFRRSDQPVQRDRSSAAGQSYFSERLRWQSILFAPEPARQSLLALEAPWDLSPRRIRFHRNHAIEVTLSVARPFLEFAGIAPEWVVGEYDDSLSFPTLEPVDLEVVWLDYARFADRMKPEEIADWLGERLAVLRSRTTSPVLVMDWDGAQSSATAFSAALSEVVAHLGDVRLADRTELIRRLGERFFDLERASLTGTRMSAEGAAGTARLLGGNWLPALLMPRLKAVVVDLDNTLYDGVLGEDGIDSVVLTEGHTELQRQLVELRDSGVLLGLLSRNELGDVDELFRTRRDFPLRWEHFAAHSVGWQPKSAGLERIAGSLRIDPSAILFVDDNPGELLEALLGVPGLRCVHAADDGYGTARALRYFPGLWAFERTEADALRARDLRANVERDSALARSADDAGAYYRELGVVLTVGQNHPDQLPRVAELSSKTNQFNLALSRYSLGQVQELARSEKWQISTARLEDRLTDSGVVAMALACRDADTLVVHELCISCRALGRRLEDLIVAQMLVSGPVFAGTREVVFQFVEGPRNQPARRWLEEFTGAEFPDAEKEHHVKISAERVLAASVNPDVRMKWSDEH
jgi:FkbH-like protein